MGCISFSRSAVPPGIKLLRRVRSQDFSFESYRTSVLLLTFIAYTLYHASRKPASIVKDVLQTDSTSNPFMHNPLPHWPRQHLPHNRPHSNGDAVDRPRGPDGHPHSSEVSVDRPLVPDAHPDGSEGFLDPQQRFTANQTSYTSPKYLLWPLQETSDRRPHRNKGLLNHPQASDGHSEGSLDNPQASDGHRGGSLNNPQKLDGSGDLPDSPQDSEGFVVLSVSQQIGPSKQGASLMEERASFNSHAGTVVVEGKARSDKGIHERLGAGSLKGWAPFDTDKGTILLGEVDVAFLASYAIGMYFAGQLGDRLCNRWFLTVGMIGSGIFVLLFGMAYWWNIHWLGYFFIVQIIAGFFQATGWPSVVTVLARWFGKRKRGLVMGIWNAHTSVGNILGSLIGSGMLTYGWGWAFIVPGISIALGGFLIFLFLVVDPTIVGFPSPNEGSVNGSHISSEDAEEHGADPERGLKSQPLLGSAEASDSQEESAVSFFKAWTIPGVAPFAFCLFFAKLVAYTFLYWLPFYIRHTEIQGEYLSDSTSGNLSTIFDVGGVLGGILAGHLSDRMRARAITAASFMYISIPLLYIYHTCGSASLWLNLVLMFMVGMFVNGPYALITTAVSADLGTHKSLKGNSKALATVTAIIDGTGSVGAAVGPLLTGYIAESGWDSVFYMLMMSALFAGLLLSKLVFAEVKELMTRSKCASGEI
eukprot:c23288_g2_i1 orf=375-2480(-)